VTAPDALTAARVCLAAASEAAPDAAAIYLATARAKLTALRAEMASLEHVLIARERELARLGAPWRAPTPVDAP
jgi:hypothetical protein